MAGQVDRVEVLHLDYSQSSRLDLHESKYPCLALGPAVKRSFTTWMDFAARRQGSDPIGGGVTEAGCKVNTNQRMKQAAHYELPAIRQADSEIKLAAA